MLSNKRNELFLNRLAFDRSSEYLLVSTKKGYIYKKKTEFDALEKASFVLGNFEAFRIGIENQGISKKINSIIFAKL